MRKLLILASIASFISSTYSQTTEIDEAEVEAFRLKAPEKLVTGVVHEIDSSSITAHGSLDMSRALNSIPGVKMETRGEGGSRRIHVRGSALRSPYSTRNSMLLIDGFVFTEADGNSPIEWLDASLVESMNVVTGPAAASYGGAYGGAFIANTTTPSTTRVYSESNFRVSETGNDGNYINYNRPTFNLFTNPIYNTRFSSKSHYNANNASFSADVIFQESPGYREYEWNQKTQVNLKANLIDFEGGLHTMIFGLYMGNWALPGAINEDEFINTPQLSPGGNYGANVCRFRTVMGYKYQTTSEKGATIKGSFLGRMTTKENQYGTSEYYNGFKDESGQGLSALISYDKSYELDNSWMLETEATVMHLNDSYELIDRDPLFTSSSFTRYDLVLDADQTFLSSSLTLTDNNKFRAVAQIGANRRSRNTFGEIYSETGPSTEYNVEKIETSFLPRLGVSWALKDNLSLFSNVSTGFSDPTAFELVDPDTNIPADLDSEKSRGIELGYRYYLSEKLTIKQTLYSQIVNHAIMQVTQDNDAVAFENVDGGLHMNGLETEIRYSSKHLNARGYATLTNHEFGVNTEHAGYHIPGTPDYIAGVVLRISQNNVGINAELRNVGPTVIVNDNSVTFDPYTVLDVSLGAELENRGSFEFGIRNILDTKYSDFPNINGFGGNYYNPAPPRTIYASLRLLLDQNFNSSIFRFPFF